MSTAISNAPSGFRNFRPPGPIGAAYIADITNRVQIIRGPVGSGKTVSSIFKALNIASRLMPVCKNGVIHCKLAVAGITYGQLERNLYPTWHYWLPKDGGEWTEGEWEGGRGRFAEQRIEFDVLRGGRLVQVKFHVIFAAIGELSVELFARGFEPSMWYLYEVDQFPDGMIEQALGRLGRFPNADMLPPKASWRGLVFGDTNSADIDSWYYKTFEELRPKGWKQYVQQGGDTPLAENVQNLPAGYYADLQTLNAHKKKWVRRFIKNQYGPAGDGDPVYEDSWSDELHLARDPLVATKGRPICIGLDQGLRPGAVITQRQATKQDWVLAELLPGRMSARRFARALLDLIAAVAPGCPISGIYADLAGFEGVDKDDGELAWAEIVSQHLQEAGIDVPVEPAPSNSPDICVTAVEDELLYMVAAGVPALLVSPVCQQLRKGFASEYKFERRAETKDQVRRPVKNTYANVHNALQYKYVGEKGRHGVIAGRQDPADPSRSVRQRYQLRGDGGSVTVKAPVDLG